MEQNCYCQVIQNIQSSNFDLREYPKNILCPSTKHACICEKGIGCISEKHICVCVKSFTCNAQIHICRCRQFIGILCRSNEHECACDIFLKQNTCLSQNCTRCVCSKNTSTLVACQNAADHICCCLKLMQEYQEQKKQFSKQMFENCLSKSHVCVCVKNGKFCRVGTIFPQQQPQHECVCHSAKKIKFCKAQKHKCVCKTNHRYCRFKQVKVVIDNIITAFETHECVCDINDDWCKHASLNHKCKCATNPEKCKATYFHNCTCNLRDPAQCKHPIQNHQCICSNTNKNKCISTKQHICQCDNKYNNVCVASYHKCMCETDNFSCKNRNKNCKCVCNLSNKTCIRCQYICQIQCGMENGFIMKTMCGHSFHARCMKDWQDQNKNTCPTCRTNLF